MEGDKTTAGNRYSDDYYKNVQLVGFAKTDSETSPGYTNGAFQWSSSDNLSGYPSDCRGQNDTALPSEYKRHDSVWSVPLLLTPYPKRRTYLPATVISQSRVVRPPHTRPYHLSIAYRF